MAFDALGILKGKYSGALVSIDESDAVAITTTANTDGNAVVDIKGTGLHGLAAVLILIGPSVAEAAAFINTDYANITIEGNDQLAAGGWVTLGKFPKIRHNLLRLSATATTAFVAADIDALITQETTADTGYLVWFDEALATIGGVGDIIVQPVDAGDVFNEAAGKTLTSATTGVATKTLGAGNTVAANMVPGIFVVRFATKYRYVRCNCEDVADSIGTGWILLTDNAFGTI